MLGKGAQASERNVVQVTPWLQPWGTQNRGLHSVGLGFPTRWNSGITNICCFKLKFIVICHTAIKKLIWHYGILDPEIYLWVGCRLACPLRPLPALPNSKFQKNWSGLMASLSPSSTLKQESKSSQKKKKKAEKAVKSREETSPPKGGTAETGTTWDVLLHLIAGVRERAWSFRENERWELRGQAREHMIV